MGLQWTDPSWRAKAEEWIRLGRGEGGLLDPAELAEADSWLNSPDEIELGIDVNVTALAEASRRAIEHQRYRKRLVIQSAIAGLTVALLTISLLAFWGEIKRREAVTLLALRAVGVMDARARGLVVQQTPLPAKALVGA